MKSYLDKAEEANRLYRLICKEAPTDYNAWKQVLIFYSCLHCIHALAKSKSIDLGDTHTKIESNLNPSEASAKMPIDKEVFDAYMSLKLNSRTCRYNPSTTEKNMQIFVGSWYATAQREFKAIKAYVEDQSIEIPFDFD